MIQLFRVLLPSWKFFDGIVDAPELWVRYSNDSIHFDEWTICIPKTGQRSWKKLLINSSENYLFACHALIEYLKNDLQEGSDPSISLSLVKNLIEFQMRSLNHQNKYFQFKLKDYQSPTFEVPQC